jgi:hypothetical protein
LDAGERDGTSKHGIDHRVRQATREGVLLADVIAAEERDVADRDLSAMP